MGVPNPNVIGWGTGAKGAEKMISKGINNSDISRMKSWGLNKDDIKKMMEYYSDFQILMDETGRKGKENTPKSRAKLMKVILKAWNKK